MPRQEIGALPYQEIKRLIEAGFIQGSNEKNVMPASLDLSLTDELYEIGGAVLPKKGEDVESLLRRIDPRKRDIEDRLECGKTYLARLSESVKLPSEIRGYCNPKSSTGRTDVHVRVLADGVQRYDSLIPAGYSGKLWVLITPKSFSIKVAPGIALSQLRLFMGDTRFTQYDLEKSMEQHQLVWDTERGVPISYKSLVDHDHDGTVLLTAHMPHDGLVGYRCIAEPDRVLDFTKKDYYDPRDFFIPVYIEDSMLRLYKDQFYVLSGAESIRIPPEFAAEMISMDMRSGDFRSHYAGFLDPGWGWGANGEGRGRPFTLEVRVFEQNLWVMRGQPIATIRFERMMEKPDVQYDTRDSNYTKQRSAQLSKHFKLWIW